jgi:hypothetical protein
MYTDCCYKCIHIQFTRRVCCCLRDLYFRDLSSGVSNALFGDAVWLLLIGRRYFPLTLLR